MRQPVEVGVGVEDLRALLQLLVRTPHGLEVLRLGLRLEEFQQLLGDLRGLDLGSLQAQSEESGGEESAAVATRPEEDPFQITLRAEMRTLLTQAINELDEKERQVLGLYYLEELTMKEVGVLLGIGESRVSQIHTAALIRLRSRLHGRLGSSTGSRGVAKPVRTSGEA